MRQVVQFFRCWTKAQYPAPRRGKQYYPYVFWRRVHGWTQESLYADSYRRITMSMLSPVMGIFAGVCLLAGSVDAQQNSGFLGDNGSKICSTLKQRVPARGLTPLVWVWDNKLDEPIGHQADTARENVRTGSHISSNLLGGLGRKVGSETCYPGGRT
jgi:hypothetical protein